MSTSLKVPSSINSVIPPHEKILPEVASYGDVFEETQKRKQANQIEFLKNEIIQTHNQTKKACEDCYADLSKIELLTFDCLLTEYLLTDPPNDIREFINLFARPTFNILSGDKRDEKQAEGHTIYLVNRIQNAIQHLQTCLKDHRLEQPKRSKDILALLNSFLHKTQRIQALQQADHHQECQHTQINHLHNKVNLLMDLFHKVQMIQIQFKNFIFNN